MSEDTSWLASLLQVSDSAFPTGGYAHSGGFEQIVQLGLVRDAGTLGDFLRLHLWPALVHFELPVVRLAWEAARQDDAPELLVLDELVEATKGTRELRVASRTMGQRRLHALRQLGATTVPSAFVRAVEKDETSGHHAVIFGAGLASLPVRAVLTAWAFQSLDQICLAAPKLLRLGSDSVQRVLADVLRETDRQVERSLEIARDDVGWFNPALEIASMQHEIAYERLFIS
jgi:urease accessory protein